MDIDPQVLEQLDNCIGETGEAYGLSFNWGKLQMLPIRTNGDIHAPGGIKVRARESMIYLNSSLSADRPAYWMLEQSETWCSQR